MEIILRNLTYNSVKEDECLNNVSYSFKEGITFCYGLKGIILKQLLFQDIKVTSGMIYVNEVGLKKDIVAISDEDFKEENFLAEINYYNNFYHLHYKNVEKRGYAALKMVGLTNDYLNIAFNKLSNMTIKKLLFARALFINPQIIIFDNYENELTGKDQEYLKKLFNKLTKMYHKNIIICSNNITPYIGIINNIVIFKNGQIVYENNQDFYYDDKVYQYLATPDIISFIKYIQASGHKIDHYLDIKEVIKSIYRDVENK